jgi:hypothetical protein
MTFAAGAYKFYRTLELKGPLPKGVRVLNPYKDQAVRVYLDLFLSKFFSDSGKRILVFGINPGRFGAGITGITFTDPVALETFCGIPNSLPKKRELSSEFVYSFIQSWGSPEVFYKHFFLTALCPLGFTKNGKNYNFYDDPKLLKAVRPFMLKSIKTQLAFGASSETAIVLGTGKVKSVFETLNQEHKFFKRILAVEHPRFIMQYRRKKMIGYMRLYKEVFNCALKA